VRPTDDYQDVARWWSDLQQPLDAVGRDDQNECTPLLGRAGPQRLDQVQPRRIHEACPDEVENQPGPVKLDLAVRLSLDDVDGRPIDLTLHRNSGGTGPRLFYAHGEPLHRSQTDPFAGPAAAEFA
jgi:hypothetical protein